MSPSSASCYFLFLIIVVIAIIIGTSLVTSSSTTEDAATRIGRTFYFESHGRDDRREWRSSFLKGLRVAKIDFNFQTNTSHCAQQTRLNPANNMTPADFPNGCLVHTHYFDPAVHDYSIPSDLFDFINAPENLEDIFSKERTQQSGPVIIQMCLKNKPGSCCPIQSGSDCDKWLNLFSAFYKEAHAKIPQLLAENRVQFVFDSIGGADNECFMRSNKNPSSSSQALFGNWNSTWTGDLDYAKDNAGPHSTQVMPNMEWSSTNAWNSIYNLSLPASATSPAAPHWGKFFAESTAYPTVAWEPSSEESIKLYHEWFLKHSIYRPAGVLVAFNPDPMLFHTMTSAQTKRFSHAAVGSTEMEGAVAAPMQSFNEIVFTSSHHHQSTSNNNNSQQQNISQSLAVSPLLLRCGSKKSGLISKKNFIECLFYQRGDHSQFIALESTLHSLDSNLASKISLPLRHVIVVGLNTTSSSSTSSSSATYVVFVLDDAAQLHTLQLVTEGVSVTNPIPMSPPKWSSFEGCPPFSPFSTIFDRNDAASVGFNHHFDDQTNEMVLSASAILIKNSSSSLQEFPIVVGSLKTTFPINRLGAGSNLPCLSNAQQLAPLIPRTVVTQNVCNNNTDTKFCQKYGKSDSSRVMLLSNLQQKKDNKNSINNNVNVKSILPSFPISDISIATTRKIQNGEVKSIVCHSLDRKTFCSTQSFVPSTTSTTMMTLANAVPRPTSVPVMASTGTSPTVSFPVSRSSSSSTSSSSPFLIRFGNSFCQNSMLIDDNTGKYFSDHICDMRDKSFTDLTSHTDLQGYLFAQDISLLESEIAQGNRHLQGFANVCNSSLLHGTFDSGSDAGTPLLYPSNPQLYDDDMAPENTFVAVVPLRSLFLVTPSFCGTSNPGFGKLRLDAFPLPGMIFNYSIAQN